MSKFVGYYAMCGYCKNYNSEGHLCNLTMCIVAKFFGCSCFKPKEEV